MNGINLAPRAEVRGSLSSNPHPQPANRAPGFIFAKRHAAAVAVVATLMANGSAAGAGICDLVTGPAGKVGAVISGATFAGGVALKTLDVAAVAHSSGAPIVTAASGGYVAGTLGRIGAVVGFLTAPVTLTVSGLLFSGITGTAAYCLLVRPGQLHLNATR
jgi:hypothetical protein